MKKLNKPIWTFLNGYFVSTNDTDDRGLETMVFPAEKGAGTRETFWNVYVHGVDFDNPHEEYTRHYDTVEQAKEGHKEIVAMVKERIKNEKS